MRHVLIASALIALAACSPKASTPADSAPAAATPIVPAKTDLPSGAYTLDKAHGSLVFRIDHLGFSHYTGRFEKWDAKLQLDTADPTKSVVDVTIDPRSINADNPPAGFMETLRGDPWLDAKKFPEMKFHSTKVELTGEKTAKITGDFTFHGVTHPATLDATFNGGYLGHPMDPHARIGFSGRGTLKRSDFGVVVGIPAPPLNMGVSDEVEFIIESELSGPAWTPPATPAP
jgi:polyisoprenoid-binding protein YceI